MCAWINLEGICVLERPLACPQLVERDAKGIQIAAVIDRVTRPASLLWGNVGERPLKFVRLDRQLALASQMGRQPEIHQACLARRVVDEKVMRFHVSMHEATRVHGRERPGHLRCVRDEARYVRKAQGDEGIHRPPRRHPITSAAIGSSMKSRASATGAPFRRESTANSCRSLAASSAGG